MKWPLADPIQVPFASGPEPGQHVLLGLCVLLLGALAAWFADANLNGYRQQLFILCAIYAVIAVALALTSGFTGVFSLGQIGFLAIGAYVSALLSMPPMVKQPMLLPGLPEWLANFDSTGWHPKSPSCLPASSPDWSRHWSARSSARH